jgi:hypothetical protein
MSIDFKERSMKRMALVPWVFLFSISAAAAQSNAFVDGLLAKSSVSAGQVSYLVLVASDNLSEDADEQRAFDLMGNLGWAPKGASIDDPVDLSTYAYILMRAFGLKGGIMFHFQPGPRYAYRELASLQVIQGRSDPSSPVDGVMAVRMLGRVFDVRGVKQ